MSDPMSFPRFVIVNQFPHSKNHLAMETMIMFLLSLGINIVTFGIITEDDIVW